MQEYDPLIEILQVAEESVEHPAKSAVLRNLQTVLKQGPNLSRELGKRIAAVLRESPDNLVRLRTRMLSTSPSIEVGSSEAPMSDSISIRADVAFENGLSETRFKMRPVLKHLFPRK